MNLALSGQFFLLSVSLVIFDKANQSSSTIRGHTHVPRVIHDHAYKIPPLLSHALSRKKCKINV